LRVEAVGVGDLQLVAPAPLHHVGDLGGEDTLVAGEPLVDDVGDAVAGGAQLRGRDHVRIARELGALLHVEEAEAHLDAPVGLRLDLADDQRLGGPRRPVAEIHLRGLARQRRDAAGVHELEEAAARKVRGHDLAHRLRLRDSPAIGITAIGIWRRRWS
jgi:hypothetical protein